MIERKLDAVGGVIDGVQGGRGFEARELECDGGTKEAVFMHETGHRLEAIMSQDGDDMVKKPVSGSIQDFFQRMANKNEVKNAQIVLPIWREADHDGVCGSSSYSLDVDTAESSLESFQCQFCTFLNVITLKKCTMCGHAQVIPVARRVIPPSSPLSGSMTTQRSIVARSGLVARIVDASANSLPPLINSISFIVSANTDRISVHSLNGQLSYDANCSFSEILNGEAPYQAEALRFVDVAIAKLMRLAKTNATTYSQMPIAVPLSLPKTEVDGRFLHFAQALLEDSDSSEDRSQVATVVPASQEATCGKMVASPGSPALATTLKVDIMAKELKLFVGEWLQLREVSEGGGGGADYVFL